jgi:hypothetical protein
VTQTEQVQVTDGMIIEWDVPIDMDDGVQLQDLYIDHDGLIARHDYAPEILGGTQAAHYLSGYEELDGSLFPTHRKVLPRGTDNRADSRLDPEPVLIGMEFAGNCTFQ